MMIGTETVTETVVSENEEKEIVSKPNAVDTWFLFAHSRFETAIEKGQH